MTELALRVVTSGGAAAAAALQLSPDTLNGQRLLGPVEGLGEAAADMSDATLHDVRMQVIARLGTTIC